MVKSPISDFEKALALTVSQATFPVGSGPKRFIRDICGGYIKQLTANGRWYLAFVAKRFRRQYKLSAEQWDWVNERLAHAVGRSDGQVEGREAEKQLGPTREEPEPGRGYHAQ